MSPQLPQDDSRSIDELFHTALTAESDDDAWAAVWALHQYGSRETLTRATELCRSDCPRERALGADILGQLGVPERTFPEECCRVLRAMLEREANDDVLQSVLIALYHQDDAEAIPLVIRFANHQNEDVRRAVTLALTGHETSDAVACQIQLTCDAASLVRDWATFAVGTQIELDTPEIRAALFARLEDKDAATRGEALVGLARRGVIASSARSDRGMRTG